MKPIPKQVEKHMSKHTIGQVSNVNVSKDNPNINID